MNAYLLNKIFSFNDFQDHLNINLTCEKFKRISDNQTNKYWEEIIEKAYFGQNIYNIFSNSDVEIICEKLQKIQLNSPNDENYINWRNSFIEGIKIQSKFERIISNNNYLKKNQKAKFCKFFKNDENEIRMFEDDLMSLLELIKNYFKEPLPQLESLEKKNEFFFQEINSMHHNYILKNTKSLNNLSNDFFSDNNYFSFSNLQNFTSDLLYELSTCNENGKETLKQFIAVFLKFRFYNDEINENDSIIINENPLLYTLNCLREKINFLIKNLLLKIKKFSLNKKEKIKNSKEEIEFLDFFLIDEFINISKIFFNASIEINAQLENINILMNNIYNHIADNLDRDKSNFNLEQPCNIPKFSIYRMFVYLWNSKLIKNIQSDIECSISYIFEKYLEKSINSEEKLVQNSEKNVFNKIFQKQSSKEDLNKNNFFALFGKKPSFSLNELSKQVENVNIFSKKQSIKFLNEELKESQFNSAKKSFFENLITNSEYLIENTLSSILAQDIHENNASELNLIDFKASNNYFAIEEKIIETINKYIRENYETNCHKKDKNFMMFNMMSSFINSKFICEKFILRTSHKIRKLISDSFYNYYQLNLLNDIEFYLKRNQTLLMVNYRTKINQFNLNIFNGNQPTGEDLFCYNFENLFKNIEENIQLEKYERDDDHLQIKIGSALKNESLILHQKFFIFVKNLIESSTLINDINICYFQLKNLIINSSYDFGLDFSYFSVEKLIDNFCEFIVFNYSQQLINNEDFNNIKDITKFYLSSFSKGNDNKNYIEKFKSKNLEFQEYAKFCYESEMNPFSKLFTAYSFTEDFHLANKIGISAENFIFSLSDVDKHIASIKENFSENKENSSNFSDCRLSIISTFNSLDDNENIDIEMENFI